MSSPRTYSIEMCFSCFITGLWAPLAYIGWPLLLSIKHVWEAHKLFVSATAFVGNERGDPWDRCEHCFGHKAIHGTQTITGTTPSQRQRPLANTAKETLYSETEDSDPGHPCCYPPNYFHLFRMMSIGKESQFKVIFLSGFKCKYIVM